MPAARQQTRLMLPDHTYVKSRAVTSEPRRASLAVLGGIVIIFICRSSVQDEPARRRRQIRAFLGTPPKPTKLEILLRCSKLDPPATEALRRVATVPSPPRLVTYVCRLEYFGETGAGSQRPCDREAYLRPLALRVFPTLVSLTPILESHMELYRDPRLSILPSIGAEIQQCRLACLLMCMRHTWSAGIQVSISFRKTPGPLSPPIKSGTPLEPHRWSGTRLKLTSDPLLHWFDKQGSGW
jgi:hypothetical protein